MKCCFCKGPYLSDKRVLEKGRSVFLCLGQGHIRRNCQKSNRCFYCKGSHNFAICENKITRTYISENSEINSATNYSANSSCVLLQTAGIILVNLVNKREVKLKTLFDQVSPWSYVTERIKSFFNRDVRLFSRDVRLFEMLVFIIRIIWILPNI